MQTIKYDKHCFHNNRYTVTCCCPWFVLVCIKNNKNYLNLIYFEVHFNNIFHSSVQLKEETHGIKLVYKYKTRSRCINAHTGTYATYSHQKLGQYKKQLINYL